MGWDDIAGVFWAAGMLESPTPTEGGVGDSAAAIETGTPAWQANALTTMLTPPPRL